MWPSFSAEGAAPIVAELPNRVVYLSSLNASSGGVWGDVEDLLRLARRLNYDAPDPDRAIEALRSDLRRQADRTRQLFLEVVGPPA